MLGYNFSENDWETEEYCLNANELKKAYNDYVTWDSYGNLEARHITNAVEEQLEMIKCELDLAPCPWDDMDFGPMSVECDDFECCDEYGCWPNYSVEPVVECDDLECCDQWGCWSNDQPESSVV